VGIENGDGGERMREQKKKKREKKKKKRQAERIGEKK
jgi:hypothetical protein